MILKYNVFTLMWAGVILLLTLLAGGARSNIEMISLDKIIHCTMFGIQSFLLIIGLKKQNSVVYLKFNAVKVAIVVTTTYGVLIECIQGVLPQRSFEWSDMLANMVGAVAGYVLFLGIYKLKFSR